MYQLGSLTKTARLTAEAGGVDLGLMVIPPGEMDPYQINGGSLQDLGPYDRIYSGAGDPAARPPPPVPYTPPPITLAPIEVEVSKAGIPGGLIFFLALAGMFAARSLR